MTGDEITPAGRPTAPFADLDQYIALPRVTGLAVSADGSRAVVTIAELNEKRTEYTSAIWELDPAGVRQARRLTYGVKGESSPVFTSDGDVLFTASRPKPDDESPVASLWRLPAAGGEAVQELTLPGGIESVRCARDVPETVLRAPLLPSARSVDDDRRLRDARKDNAVTAILHSSYPIRYWDKDIGPGQPHLIAVDGVSDLTPGPGGGLIEADFDVSADGSFIVTGWRLPGPGASLRTVLARIDVRTGERTIIADDPDADLEAPVISPDGTGVAFVRETVSTPHSAIRISLGYLRFGGEPTAVAPDWDRWPTSVAWSHDGRSLIVTADQDGRGPVFRVDPTSSSVTQLTDDDFAYTDVHPAPGDAIFALRSSYAAPPHPVRIDADGRVVALPCVEVPRLPGELIDIETTADDGTRVRSWLVLPEAQEPAPLLLWIHGGPLNSWNAWTWRWNPWLMAARGYAVLLPDPALSTGYGQGFVERGWGAWGGAPYTDLMAATDAACAHPRIDGTRTAAMGGSFGGYMANWVAGHTNRFDAIVTHASLWALEQFGPTTDSAYYWAREMTQEMATANSPHLSVGEIATPMLVIHGDKDYRVPIGEGLRLWYELLTASGLPADASGGTEHRFLYFPSENHWVLAPQHAKIWYQVVTAFLARHVLGEEVELPELLG